MGSKDMEIKVQLTMTEDSNVKERVADAQKKKMAGKETMEEAWTRILGMKNSAGDQEKLLYVAQAFKEGRIGREPTAKGKFSKAEALRIWRYLQDQERNDKLRRMVENTPENYVLINTVEKMDKLLEDLYDEEIIALDTETTGLDFFGDDKTVGMSITLPKHDYHVYIPYGHRVDGIQLPEEYVIYKLKPRLESGMLKKVLHNAKFDIHMLRQHGIHLNGLVWDTMVAMHLLNENEPSFALKNLATKYLNEPSDTFETLFGKTMFYNVPLDVALVYACKDTHLTWRLYQFQLKHLTRMPTVLRYYREVENELILVSVEMEKNGFILDKQMATKLGEKLSREIAELEEQLKAEFGDINYNSPKQLGEKLFDELQLHRHFGRDWKRSTDVDTLKTLAQYNKGCELLLEYREKTKLLSTYIEALPKQVKKDGRIHGSFNQSGTVTGRYSSNNPNLQNQPKFARKLFIAPEGMVIIGGDFSQQEPRLLAHFSGEQALIDAYNDGKDLYSTMASMLWGLPIEECGDGSKWRKMMKAGILAVMYGTGPKTLANQLGITEDEARKFINDFYARFTKVANWIECNKAYLRKYGYVWMMGNQRKRRIPQVKSEDRWERFRAERQATNARIQGSASIQTKKTMIALYHWCAKKREQGREFYIVATIHDEILMYAPLDVTREEVEEFRDIMVNTVKLIVPNKTDIEIMERWGEGVSVDEWFNNRAV